LALPLAMRSIAMLSWWDTSIMVRYTELRRQIIGVAISPAIANPNVGRAGAPVIGSRPASHPRTARGAKDCGEHLQAARRSPTS